MASHTTSTTQSTILTNGHGHVQTGTAVGEPGTTTRKNTERTGLNFRPPCTLISQPSDFTAPTVEFLQGRWHVTHSTLPMWKTNRNVTITYRSLPNNAEVLDDLVEYQPVTSDKRKRIEGVDTPDAEMLGAYSWRGRGFLKLASSHWQILGYGDEDGGWVVTYFQKTLFTPAGIDLYARRKGGLSDELLEQIRGEISAINDKNVTRLADLLFPIHHNW
ncbi:hypothetical protein PV10_02803 [Exophiala mesophila]|uniref:Lipocalin-like domain-containing protein n=1 Tax=Exophiala mesophila TaxID=212818 RepID=A0A0D1ZMD2_EXOME|nr:uncharacterized protein PV10_02803 [Exophiala mesophila]KIV95114.1 hypothetical protein PV10_02803 [Exophiala mesophila]